MEQRLFISIGFDIGTAQPPTLPGCATAGLPVEALSKFTTAKLTPEKIRKHGLGKNTVQVNRRLRWQTQGKAFEDDHLAGMKRDFSQFRQDSNHVPQRYNQVVLVYGFHGKIMPQVHLTNTCLA